MDTGITVFVPNGFHREKHYKITYIIHGLKGNHNTWTDYTLFPFYANDYPSIFILPEVNRSFYTDMMYGQKFYTYVADELPEICRQVFNVSSKREDTAIMGASMGGYGALKLALSKPEQYGYCGAFASACLFLKEKLDFHRNNESQIVETFGEQINRDFKSIFGPQLDWKPAYEILDLAKKANTLKIKPRIYMACGTDDIVCYEDNVRFRNEIEKLDFDFIYEEWEGKHDWIFFGEALKKSLAICFK